MKKLQALKLINKLTKDIPNQQQLQMIEDLATDDFLPSLIDSAHEFIVLLTKYMNDIVEREEE